MLIEAGAENGLNSLTTLRDGDDEVGDVRKVPGEDGGLACVCMGLAGMSGTTEGVREALRYARYFCVNRGPGTCRNVKICRRVRRNTTILYLFQMRTSVC
jgi:hypothetical protein